MLKIQDITVEYDDVPTLENFSLEMKPGEIVSLVGESGSGKTTAIRAVLGLLPGNGAVTKGDILFNGSSLLDMSEKQLDSIRGTDIAMIFQDSGAMINPIRRIGSQFEEYIRFHTKMSRQQAEVRAEEMLELMCLPNVKRIMRSYPFQLSGGQRQRVGIAMAMCFQPRLLLADEPTSALDVTTQAQIVRQMLQMNKLYNTGIILVTHNLGVAAYMSDKIIVMKDGHIVEQGNRQEVLHHSRSEYTKKLIEAIPVLDGDTYV